MAKTGLARAQFAKKSKLAISANSPAPKRRKGLKQGRSTGTPTKAESQRFKAIKLIGCICCMRALTTYNHDPYNPGPGGVIEIHHLTVGGKHGQKRRGHRFTIGLCQWHHQGIPGACFTGEEGTKRWLGPSYKLHAREFRERFGDDDTLLAFQDELVEHVLKWSSSMLT